MKNLFSAQAVLKNELKELLNSKTTKEWETNLEKLLEKLSTNSLFLNSLSVLLNTQSVTKLFLNSALEKVWKNLQLPNKKDQEKTLYLIHELLFKVHQLEKELKQQKLRSYNIQPLRKSDSSLEPHLNIIKSKSNNNLTNIV